MLGIMVCMDNMGQVHPLGITALILTTHITYMPLSQYDEHSQAILCRRDMEVSAMNDAPRQPGTGFRLPEASSETTSLYGLYLQYMNDVRRAMLGLNLASDREAGFLSIYTQMCAPG